MRRTSSFVLIIALVLTVITITFVRVASRSPAVNAQGVPPLHYKSRLGLMPPAYGLDPQSPAVAADAPAFSRLNPATSIPVGSWAQVLATADLTGDGRSDAAVATARFGDSTNDEQLHLFVPDSTAILTRTQRLAAGENPESIVAADLNQDGRADTALALAGDAAVKLYTQNTAQQLNAAVTLPLLGGPDALSTGDFTGDRRPDLVAVAPLSGTINLWQSTPDGLTPLPFTLPYITGGFDALAVGDLDNDGDDDLAALRGAGSITSAVVVYLQTNGFFPVSYTLTPETGGFLPHSLTVGDVNSDGRDDIVVTAGGNMPDAYLNVFLQGDAGMSTTPVTYPAYHLPSAVAIGDLDHDGRNDVAVLHDSWRTLSVYTQTISGALSPYSIASIPFSDRYRPQALALADLDNNGGLDAALVDRDHGLTILTNTLTVPTANIMQPHAAAVVPVGTLAVSGTASANAERVEVRLCDATSWLSTTLTGGTWQTSLTLPNVERDWWIEARAIDAQGHVQSPLARQRIGVEAGEAPQGQLIINDGAFATNQPTVTLTLPAADPGGVAAMRFSPDGVLFTDWVSYTLTSDWTFTSGDGIKTLFVQFRDSQAHVSAAVSDSILLDTLPPTSELTAITDAPAQPRITLSWSGADQGSGIAFYDIEMRAPQSSVWSQLLQHTSRTTTTITVTEEGRYCFRSRAIDQAGNTEGWLAGEGDACVIVSDDIPITGVTIAGTTIRAVGIPATLLASVIPVTATTPITYTWQATGQDSTTTSGGPNTSVAFTWNVTGTQHITVTASNAVSTVTDTHTITVMTTIPVISPTNITISGAVEGNTEQAQTFSADVETLDTTTPITYVWQATGQSPVIHRSDVLTDAVSFTWNTPGTQSLTVTATNAGGTVTDTHTIAIRGVVPVVPITAVAIAGRTGGRTTLPYTFDATASPLNTTTPITYVWQATGQSPTTHLGMLPRDSITFTWDITGVQGITVTATSAGKTVTDTHTITITDDAIALDSIVINGVTAGTMAQPYTFTGVALPETATMPVTYTWTATGQSPVTRSINDTMDTITYTWNVTGTQFITLTATNGIGSTVTDTHTILIGTLRWPVYLPLVEK